MLPKTSVNLNENEQHFIRNIPLFGGLTEGEKQTLLKDGRLHTYQRRQTIFRQGDPLQNLYVVSSGIVQVFRETPNGQEMTLDILIPGDMTCTREICELSTVYTAHAVAVNSAVVLALPKSWLLETAQRNGVFAMNLLAALSRRSRMTEVDAEHQATMSAPQLVACFLQHMCSDHNFNPTSFDLPISKTLIASRLGMQLETFSRTLPALKKYGITVSGKNVSFRDFGSVEKNVCEHCSVMDTCHAYKKISTKFNKTHPNMMETARRA